MLCLTQIDAKIRGLSLYAMQTLSMVSQIERMKAIPLGIALSVAGLSPCIRRTPNATIDILEMIQTDAYSALEIGDACMLHLLRPYECLRIGKSMSSLLL